MARAKANGIEIEYETFGSRTDPALLLIMGLGAQLTLWPETICEGLAAQGFFVVRYDNRDVGLSTDFDAWGMPDLMGAFANAACAVRNTTSASLPSMRMRSSP